MILILSQSYPRKLWPKLHGLGLALSPEPLFKPGLKTASTTFSILFLLRVTVGGLKLLRRLQVSEEDDQKHGFGKQIYSSQTHFEDVSVKFESKTVLLEAGIDLWLKND